MKCFDKMNADSVQSIMRCINRRERMFLVCGCEHLHVSFWRNSPSGYDRLHMPNRWDSRSTFRRSNLAEFEVRLAEMAQLPVFCAFAILISDRIFYDASWALNLDLLLEQLILIFPISVARFPPESKLAPINKWAVRSCLLEWSRAKRSRKVKTRRNRWLIGFWKPELPSRRSPDALHFASLHGN